MKRNKNFDREKPPSKFSILFVSLSKIKKKEREKKEGEKCGNK